MKYLITGVAGFIGYRVVLRLCRAGHSVVGIDNLNNYYDVNLKLLHLDIIVKVSLFRFEKIDLNDRNVIATLFYEDQFDRVIHLAAQAGVRYSIENPMPYAESNLVGHLNILEGCRNNNINHLLYASSSSVYGLNNKVPFSTNDTVDHPISLYAATKRSNELMAHSYSHLYDIPTTGLRLFSVYGPWGRPDMAPYIFIKKILAGDTIDIAKRFRVTYENNEFPRGNCHVNGIEPSQSFTKRRLAKFNDFTANLELHLRECKWRQDQNFYNPQYQLWGLSE